MRVLTTSSLRRAVGAFAISALAGVAAGAQAPKRGSKASAAPAALAGSYAGTATVPLGDSTIVVPVSYLFTGTAPAIGGTAMVPGQGTGTISQVVREGARLRFRVTAGEGKLLEHEGTVSPNGAIEGMVNLDGKPVAKFRIVPGALPAPKPATPTKSRGDR